MAYNYKILQISDIRKCNYAFHSWKIAILNGFKVSDYYCVYTGFIDDDNISTDYDALEYLYMKFNTERPDDFYGHSLSVSDIVIIGVELYYCDVIGWKRIGYIWEYM